MQQAPATVPVPPPTKVTPAESNNFQYMNEFSDEDFQGSGRAVCLSSVTPSPPPIPLSPSLSFILLLSTLPFSSPLLHSSPPSPLPSFTPPLLHSSLLHSSPPSLLPSSLLLFSPPSPLPSFTPLLLHFSPPSLLSSFTPPFTPPLLLFSPAP